MNESMNPGEHFRGYRWEDLAQSPLMLYFEVTQACDLVCKHCRASAQPESHPSELDTEKAIALLRQATEFPRKPNIVFTGGDPLKRRDIWRLLETAVQLGLNTALTPSATPLATSEALRRAKDIGVTALGVSLDGADAVTHDGFRGWEGSFARTLEILETARDLGFYIQVNTTITRRNHAQVDALAELLARYRIAMWSVFFLVPVGRGQTEERISAEEYEEVFARLWQQSLSRPYAVKTTEAPHYRRFMLRQVEQNRIPLDRRKIRSLVGVGDGRGIMFVSHLGEIYPAGFLPVFCGLFPKASIVDVYQRHPVFQALRQPDRFRGKCGKCAYRYVCGGSRSRAYAVTGDYLESEPDCVYISEPDAAPILPETLRV